MPLPGAWATVTVTGTYVDQDTGLPASGYVTFDQAPDVVVSGIIVKSRLFRADLDASGHFSIVLPSSNDPDILPTGWAWRVTEYIESARDEYYIAVPYNAGTLDLSTVVPLTPDQYVILESYFAKLADLASTATGKGASLIGFLQGGAGAIARNAMDKMAEWRSILDYGAVLGGNTTTNRIAIQNAFNSGNGSPAIVVVPPGEWCTDLPVNRPDFLVVLMFGTIRNTNNAGDNTSVAITSGNLSPSMCAALTLYTAPGVSEGANAVVLDSGANRTNGVAAMPVGTTVYWRSKTYTLQNGQQIPTSLGMARVTACDAGTGTITFHPPFHKDVANVLIGPATQPAVGAYSCYRSAIIGPGGFKSDSYYWTYAGGELECTTDIGFVEGQGGHFGNLFCHSYHRIRTINVTGRIQDNSFGSNNSIFECVSAYTTSTGASPGVIFESGQHGCKNTTKYGSVYAPFYTGSSDCILVATGTQDSHLEIGYCFIPLATGRAVYFSNNTETVSGDQVQHVGKNNSFRCKRMQVGANATHYVYIGNNNGLADGNSVLEGHFSGAVTNYAIEAQGTNTFIGPNVVCDTGALRVDNGATVSTDGPYFDGGVSFDSAVSLANQNIRNVRSAAQKLLRAAYCSGVLLTINATAANNVVTGGTSTAAAGCIAPGDGFYFRCKVNITGTNNTKTVQFRNAAGVVLGSISFAAGDTGQGFIEGNLTVASDAIYSVQSVATKGTTPATTAVRATGKTLNASGEVVTFESWVANAADTIRVDSFEMGWQRKTANLP